MKKIISIFIASIVAVSTITPSVIAATELPVSASDVSKMIMAPRTSKWFWGHYEVCKTSFAPEKGDDEIIKASGQILVDYINSVLNPWKAINVPTNKQKEELDKIKVMTDTELNDPKMPSWFACDKIMDSLAMNTMNTSVAEFPQASKNVFNELKSTTPITIRPNLEYFESKTMSGKVAVFTDKKTGGFISVLPQFKAVIVKKTNLNGDIIGYYVFIPQNEINKKNAYLDGFKVDTISIDILAKMYMKLAPDVNNGPHKVAPLKKI